MRKRIREEIPGRKFGRLTTGNFINQKVLKQQHLGLGTPGTLIPPFCIYQLSFSPRNGRFGAEWWELSFGMQGIDPSGHCSCLGSWITGGKGVIPHQGIYSREMFRSVQRFIFPKAAGASHCEWAGRGVCVCVCVHTNTARCRRCKSPIPPLIKLSVPPQPVPPSFSWGKCRDLGTPRPGAGVGRVA